MPREDGSGAAAFAPKTDREREAYGRGIIDGERLANLKHNGEINRDATPCGWLDWETLDERGDPPQRSWLIEHWLGAGHVTLMAGRGAIGKSLVAQQIAASLALGVPFFAPTTRSATVLAWMGEDEHDELWRRQHAIAKRMGRSLSELRGRLYLESTVSTDRVLLARVQGSGLERTSNLKLLREQIGDLKAELVTLDNIAHLYQGDENDRSSVTAFLVALSWALEANHAACLLLGHVAKTKDSEWAGSTAWENSVRSRWWLTDAPPDRPSNPNDDELEAPTTDLRYLAKRKTNYSTRDVAVLRYAEGSYEVMASPSAPAGIVATIDRRRCAKVTLAAFYSLRNMGLQPTASSSSHSYLPRLVIEHGLGEHYLRADISRGMRDLMGEGALKQAEIGRKANRTPRFGLVPGNGAAA